jgi:hypothetical protein
VGPQIERSGAWVAGRELQQELGREGGSFVLFSGARQGASAPMVWQTTIKFTHFPDTPIVDVCRDYLALMNSIINEYEAQATLPG